MSAAGAIWLVARRELTERARDRSFAISTAITLAILLAVAVLPRLFGFGDEDPARVGASGPGAEQILAALESQPGAADAVDAIAVADAEDAVEQVRSGELDAAVVGDARIVVDETLPDDLGVRLQAASASVRATGELEGRGIVGAEAGSILAPAPLPVEELQPSDGDGGNEGLAFVAVLVLYGQVFGYGFWVAMGVVEEKASRVVEILLSTVTARQLLAGKILGIGLLGLMQLVGLAVIVLAAAWASGAVEAPADAISTIAVVLGFFVLGYAFYAGLFAAAAAAVSRQEELQNATTPLTMLILGSLIVAIVAVDDPGGELAVVTSLVPPLSAIVMPTRIAAGGVPGWQVAISIVLLLGATALLVPAAARVYSNAVLRTGGRVRIRDAWRAER